MRHVIYVSLIFFVTSCCSWDFNDNEFEFTRDEMSLISSYNIGDTIYFESDQGDIDTIVILNIFEEKDKGNKCFISKPPSNHKIVYINHIPEDNWIGTTFVENDKKKTTYQRLISISKYPLKKEKNYTFGFKDFSISQNSLFDKFQSNCIINGKMIKDCYKITRFINSNDSPSSIQTIYWTNMYGLTAYSAKNGETWIFQKKR